MLTPDLSGLTAIVTGASGGLGRHVAQVLARYGEMVFDGPEVPPENVLMAGGNGLKVTQMRPGPARLTHCMRWLGLSKRCTEIATAYATERHGFGVRLANRASIRMMPGDPAMRIGIGRLLDGTDEVHRMVLDRHLAAQGGGFWKWNVAE